MDEMTKEKLFIELNKTRGELISLNEVYLDSVAGDAIKHLKNLKTFYKNKFLLTINDVIDDLSYQIEKEFDLYQKQRGKKREESYHKEKFKIEKSLDRVLSPLRHEIQGHGEID